MTIPEDAANDRPAGSWQRWAVTSSLLAALADEDYGVEDLVAFTGADTPAWVGALPVPAHWQQMDLAETEVAIAPARVLVWGPHAQGGWEATDTLSVYGYTGRPAFGDVLDSTAEPLRDLEASDLTTWMLALPATVGVAAERSTAIMAVDGRRIWTQLTHYVAGNDEPRAGRLIVHSLYVAQERRPELAGDIRVLTQGVQDTFTALFTTRSDGGGG
jgi:hypothetical protein